MIFTGIKRKSNQLFLKKNLAKFLNNSYKNSSDKLNNIVVFLDEISEKENIQNSLIELFKLSENNITILVFQKQIIKNEEGLLIFTSKDFGWYGKIKSNELNNILTKKYDLLINYSKVENLYSNLLLLQCKTAFRVGFSYLDNRFYDLIIDCKLTEMELFNAELKKYLTILNKI